MMRLCYRLSLLLSMQLAMADVPVVYHAPANASACTAKDACPVTMLSPGYGLSGTDYSFIIEHLTAKGYLVVALQDSAGGKKLDPAAPKAEQLRALARESVKSLSEAITEGMARYPAFDWQHLLLIGHSLGGDSSALFAGENTKRVSNLITLDNRRIALPRSPDIHVLTIRAGDTTADAGVLPNESERSQFGTCVVRIDHSRHNDMQDGGSAQLKASIIGVIDTFLGHGPYQKHTCSSDSTVD